MILRHVLFSFFVVPGQATRNHAGTPVQSSVHRTPNEVARVIFAVQGTGDGPWRGGDTLGMQRGTLVFQPILHGTESCFSRHVNGLFRARCRPDDVLPERSDCCNGYGMDWIAVEGQRAEGGLFGLIGDAR